MTYSDYHIEEYVQGVMPEKLRIPFEQELEQNSSLRRLVEAERALVNAVRRDASINIASASEVLPSVLAAKLASTPAVTAGAAAGGGIMSAIFGTKVGIFIVSVIGGLGILLGILLAGSIFGEEEPSAGTNSQDRIESEMSSGEDGSLTPLTQGSEEESPSMETPLSQRRNAEEKSSYPIEKGSSVAAEANEEEMPLVRDLDDRNEASTTTETNPSRTMLDALREEEKNHKTPRTRKGEAEVKVEVE